MSRDVREARDKILPLAQLNSLLAAAKRAGRSVVHCHGVFDLLHLGHVRHLEQASQLGQILVVTITADSFVNKGPGRPVFRQELRAEMLAALAYVDWVAINDAPDALPAIEAVAPDIYVKGEEYRNEQEDVTGKITAEREAVERNGGRIQYTDGVTFSSSTLINQHFNLFDEEIRKALGLARSNNGLARMLDLIESVKDYRVVLVGDAILDEYLYVVPLGKSPKENLIPTLYKEGEIFAGGVIAAANHVASLCREVEIVTVLGQNRDEENLIRAALKPNVTLTPIYRTHAPTTRKTRFVDPTYVRKLFEVYHMDDTPLDEQNSQKLSNLIRSRTQDADVVITTDFGHGMIGPNQVDILTGLDRFLAVNAQTNSANIGYNLITKYPRADYICIDAPEARLAMHDKDAALEDLAASQLRGKVQCSKIVLTHGRHGCVAWSEGNKPIRIPALTQQVVDTVGAGDAFLAITAPLVKAGGEMSDVGLIGNVAGALKVQIVGHRKSIEKSSIIKALTGLLK